MTNSATLAVEARADSGNAVAMSPASQSAGHQNISGPMCVRGRRSQTQRPTAMPIAIVTAK